MHARGEGLHQLVQLSQVSREGSRVDQFRDPQLAKPVKNHKKKEKEKEKKTEESNERMDLPRRRKKKEEEKEVE